MTRTILLLASFFAHFSQVAAAPPDAALAHFDKSFYVSGEVVWYKLYLPAPAQGKDFSVQLSILDGAGALASKTFLLVEKKAVCHGHFELPFDAAPGVYTFIFSASRKSGTSDELLRAHVPVFNDLLPWDEKTAVQTIPDGAPPAFSNELKVSVQMVSEGSATARQNVRLKISVTDPLGNPVSAEGSLSVTDEQLCGAKISPALNFQTGANVSADEDWLAGIYKSGLVRHADGRLMTSTLIPVLDVETHRMYFAKSAVGKFTLQLPAYEGVRRLQVVGLQEEPLKVEWQEGAANAVAPKLTYTEGILRYLDLSRKRKKIYQFYSRTETGLQTQASKLDPIVWKGKQVFKVQDYERFPDLATFFQEVIWRVKFSKKGERYFAKMYNTDVHADFPESPLFLLDQKAIFDADFVARLDPAGIETIELLFEPKLLRKLYPVIGGGGVVRIKTLSGNQSLPLEKESEILPLQGLLLSSTFPVASPNPAEPLLRPVVFWQPSFTTDKNGAATVSFLQTDDRSTFCAEVLVQGPDGQRGYTRFCYKVE